jgi:hypothetical protein
VALQTDASKFFRNDRHPFLSKSGETIKDLQLSDKDLVLKLEDGFQLNARTEGMVPSISYNFDSEGVKRPADAVHF